MDKCESVSVSIVIPVYNEEKYISECIDSVLKQDYAKDDMELILVDGCSQDGTVDIIKKFMKEYDFIKLYDNPKMTVQYALNIGIKNSNGTYIVRMDAHSEYATDYISKCVEYLKKTGADNVGGPMVAKGKNSIQKVIAAAYHSIFALGGGKFHDVNYEGYADTVYLGAFKKDTLINLDMYDERLPRSEDDDLNYRIIENGGKIYVTPNIKSVYYPRSTLKDLFLQYFDYGLWKVAVIKKHKKPARLSHLIPMLFVIFLVFFGIGAIFSQIVKYLFFAVFGLYLVLAFYFSFTNDHIKGVLQKLKLVYVHFILHVSYGLGFITGIFKFFNTKWS